MPILSCRVCSKPAPSQVVLLCGHHFCDRCLQLWLSLHCPSASGSNVAEPGVHFPCQLCWTTCTVPPGGLCDLRNDDTGMVAGLVNQMEGMTMHQGNSININIQNSNKPDPNQGFTGLYDPSLLLEGAELACTPQNNTEMMTDEVGMQEADEAPATTNQQTMIQQGSGFTREYDAGRRYCFPSCHTYQYHLI